MRWIDWFIARRYLFSHERKALVSLITIISMAGVAVGVAALIVVIGVMDGADELLFGKVADLYPHLRIVPHNPDQTIDETLIEKLRARPDVLHAEPIIEKQTLIQNGKGVEALKSGIQLVGMDELSEHSIYGIPNMAGKPPIRLRKGEILLGAPLMAKLQAWPPTPVSPGSRVLIIATNPVSTAMGPLLKTTEMQVVGYFRTNFYEFDANVAFVSNEEIRRIYRIPPGRYDYIHVKLRDPFASDMVKHQLLGNYDVSYTRNPFKRFLRRADELFGDNPNAPALEPPSDGQLLTQLGDAGTSGATPAALSAAVAPNAKTGGGKPLISPLQYEIRTWSEENGAFFGALQLEKLGLFVILLLIILVAAFNIIGTLILMVIEKTREIGILRAVGASEGMVWRVFMLNGMLIGLVGTLLGVLIGLGVCALIPTIKINMPEAVYNFDHLPVKVKFLTVSLIVCASMAICTLAAIFPARSAARLHPVEALRYD